MTYLSSLNIFFPYVYLHARTTAYEAYLLILLMGCVECGPDFFGSGCLQRCICTNGGRCDHVTGTCLCLPGWTGEQCEEGRNCLPIMSFSINLPLSQSKIAFVHQYMLRLPSIVKSLNTDACCQYLRTVVLFRFLLLSLSYCYSLQCLSTPVGCTSEEVDGVRVNPCNKQSTGVHVFRGYVLQGAR